MKKEYFSPEFDLLKLSFERLLGDVDTSNGEQGKEKFDDEVSGDL